MKLAKCLIKYISKLNDENKGDIYIYIYIKLNKVPKKDKVRIINQYFTSYVSTKREKKIHL